MSEEMKNGTVNIEDTQETEEVTKKDENKAEKFIRLGEYRMNKGVNPFVISLINEKMEEKNYADRIPTGVKEINKEKETDESAEE